MRRLLNLTAAALLLGTTAPICAQTAAPIARSDKHQAMDASRKPDQTLAFAGITPGMRVLDLFGANRYWAEFLVPVVGPQGQVISWQPIQFLDAEDRAALTAFAAAQPNYTWLTTRFENPMLGEGLYDAALMNLDYHDTYWTSTKYDIVRMDPDAWLKRLHAAMKTGGTVTVIDHAATPGGDTRDVVEKLHRIDPAVVRADFERAGFTYLGSNDYLANPADDHSLSVFDPAIRGKTDRFAMRFAKNAE